MIWEVKRFLRYFPLLFIAGMMLWSEYGYLNRPLWGDEAAYLDPKLMHQSYLKFMTGKFVVPMGHPYLHPLISKIGYDITGNWMVTPILFSFVSALACLLFLHLFAEKYAGPRAAWMSVAIFASLQVVYSYSASAQSDFPPMAAGIAALWLGQRRRWGWMAFFLCFAILYRESALASIVAAGVFFVFLPKEKRAPAWSILLPFGCLLLHFWLSRRATGDWLAHPIMQDELLHTKINFMSYKGKWDSLLRAIDQFDYMFNSFGWVPAAFALPLFVRNAWREKHLDFIGLCVTALIFAVFFVWYQDHVSHDFLPVFFLFSLVFGMIGSHFLAAFPSKKVDALVLFIAFWSTAWHLNFYASQATMTSGPDLFRIKFVQSQIDKIRECCSDKKVYVEYPLAVYMGDPFYGYVKEPFPIEKDPKQAEIIVTSSFFTSDVSNTGERLWTDKFGYDWVTVRKPEPPGARTPKSSPPEGAPRGP